MEQRTKTFKVKDKLIGGHLPLICIPLIGKDMEELITEVDRIKGKQPDLIEWRADYFEDLDDEEKVVHALQKISESVGEIPLLFTIRSAAEGGQHIRLTEEAKLHLFTVLSATGSIDLIDYEVDNEKRDLEYLREVTKDHGVRLITSYHNFEQTPTVEDLLEKGTKAELYQADVIKVSVMPNNMDDVLVLLEATQSLDRQVNIPVVSISMGDYGSISRMFGWKFGSAITFGIGEQSSAPGQIPVEDLRSVINMIDQSS